MGEALKRRLRQTKFQSPHQEAAMALMVASSNLQEMFDAICADYGISRQQYNILRILRGAGNEGHPCGEIASRMIDHSPDVTRRIDGLVKLALVDRTRSDGDRRVVICRITDEGLGLLEKMEPKEREFIARVRRRLSAPQCRELTALCEQLFSDET